MIHFEPHAAGFHARQPGLFAEQFAHLVHMGGVFHRQPNVQIQHGRTDRGSV